jgi:hypothetical protein
MPDADILRNGLTKGERSVYEQICEGVDPPEVLANRMLKQLRKRIRRQQFVVFELLGLLSAELSQLPQEPLFRLQADPKMIHAKLADIAHSVSMQTKIDQKCVETAVEVCYATFCNWMDDFSLNAVTESDTTYLYLLRQHESIMDRMLAQAEHPNKVRDNQLRARLNQIVDISNLTLRRWSSSIVSRRDLNYLRLLGTKTDENEITLDEKLTMYL